MKRDLWLEGPVAFGLGGGQWGSNVWKNTLDCWREDGSNPDPWLPRLYLWSTSKFAETDPLHGYWCLLPPEEHSVGIFVTGSYY